MTKQIIKESESRILIYLSVVPAVKKNLIYISQKLNIDYGYTMRILSEMNAKGWVFKHKHGRFMAYDLTPKAPLELAKQMYMNDELQKKLEEVE